jgi:hypothetical protein
MGSGKKITFDKEYPFSILTIKIRHFLGHVHLFHLCDLAVRHLTISLRSVHKEGMS